MTTIQVGDTVEGCREDRYRVVGLVNVYGILSADLVRLRKDGTDTVQVRRVHKSLPVSCLEKVN